MGINGVSMWQLLVIVILFAYVIPMIHVAVSNRSDGLIKFAWCSAVFLFSLLAYIPFLLVTNNKERA